MWMPLRRGNRVYRVLGAGSEDAVDAVSRAEAVQEVLEGSRIPRYCCCLQAYS